MKNKVKKIFMLCLSLFMMIPSTAYASDDITDVSKSALSDEEIERIVAPYEKDYSTASTAGLIDMYVIAVEKSGSYLLVAAKTVCGIDVVKCGYTEIRIQRRQSNRNSWSDYIVYEDLYRDSSSYVFGSKIRPQSGYQYRATCIHYAKKSIFSTEKINDSSNIVTM